MIKKLWIDFRHRQPLCYSILNWQMERSWRVMFCIIHRWHWADRLNHSHCKYQAYHWMEKPKIANYVWILGEIQSFSGNQIPVFIVKPFSFYWLFFHHRFSELGPIPAKHCDRCETRLPMVCETSFGFTVQFDYRPCEIGRITVESNKCKIGSACNR